MAYPAVVDPVVVVTGAGSGIGAAAAVELARRGGRLVLAGRREDALRTVAAECHRVGGEAVAVPTDVTDPVQVERLGDAAAAAYGRVDAWINCAGVTAFGRFGEVTPAEFARVVAVDLLGTANGTRTALRQLRRSGRGVIINVSSVLGEVPAPYQSAYTAAKYGVRGLTASVRQELRLAGERGIAVCTLSPASTDTPIFRHAANRTGRTPHPVPPVYPARAVVRVILKLLRRPRPEARVGAARLLSRAARLAPRLVERLGGRYIAATALGADPAPVHAGNLFDESEDDARIPGGYHGGMRTALRRSTAIGLVAGTAAVLARRAAARHGV